jgi:hypothetical protein
MFRSRVPARQETGLADCRRVRRMSMAVCDTVATRNGRPPVVRPVTPEGAHSCAPVDARMFRPRAPARQETGLADCRRVRRMSMAVCDIVATRNGRPPVVRTRDLGAAVFEIKIKLIGI